MELSYQKIKEIFPQFNEVALTENDFWLAAKRSKIIVREELLLIDGYYEKKRGKHYIVINSKLRGVQWLHTALHELMHFYLDMPIDNRDIKFYRSRLQVINKREKIADALALIGIMPMPELEKLMKENLTENLFLMNLVRDRIAVLAEQKR